MKRINNIEAELLAGKLVQEPSDKELEQKVVEREKSVLQRNHQEVVAHERTGTEKQFSLAVTRRNVGVRRTGLESGFGT